MLAQIPNGGFENWTTVDGHLDPDDWITTNDATAPFGVISCEQGTPGAVGTAYAKITSHLFPGTPNVIPGFLSVGDLDAETAGFPYTERPAALNGSIQYAIQPGDQGTITVGFILNGAAIGAAILYLNGTQSGWTSFSMPINYDDGTTHPDSAYINISSSGSPGMDGSTVSVDNLTFGSVSGIQEMQEPVELHIFPTVTSDVLNIVAGQPLAHVDILDMTGRALMDQGTNAENITMNVSDLNTGRYLVQVYLADGRRLVRSFVKQ